jgi:hypothetical protein
MIKANERLEACKERKIKPYACFRVGFPRIEINTKIREKN